MTRLSTSPMMAGELGREMLEGERVTVGKRRERHSLSIGGRWRNAWNDVFRSVFECRRRRDFSHETNDTEDVVRGRIGG